MPSSRVKVERVFHALGDPTRRAMVERIGTGPVSVSHLAEPLGVTLAAVLQHVQILEESGLVRTEKTGRVRVCSINPEGLDILDRWVKDRRSAWEKRLDRLGEFLATDENKK